MNFFEFLRLCQDWLKMQHRKLKYVVLHRTLIARGYFFLVEYNEEYYLLINSYDFDIAQAWLVQTFPMTDTTSMIPEAIENTELVKKVVCGVFRLAS